MKTNQILTRKMGGFEVCQRTKDGYFDGNALLRQWNSNPENPQRFMDKFFESPNTKEFIETITIRESNLYQKCDKIDFQAVKKSKIKEPGKSGRPMQQIWMHPYLFIDFAMWLNPSFKYDVLKFVHDELIKYRNEAGDAYREMSSAIATIVDKSSLSAAMQDVAKALNYIVFDGHQSDMRNKRADESKIKELCELEKDIAKLIRFGFVKSFDALKTYLRNRWRDRRQSEVLTA